MDSISGNAPSSKTRFPILLITIVLLIILFAGAVAFMLVKKPALKNTVSSSGGVISGSFDINGVVPNGSTITLTEKVANSSDSPVVFAEGITPSDKNSWYFANTVSGKTYEVQASLMQNGIAIAQSSPIIVTSPADDEVLVLNVESDAPVTSAAISGNIVVNGYIPTGATITVSGRPLGGKAFTTFASNLPGQATQYLSYSSAIGGTTYEVQAQLLDGSGNNIGTSGTLMVTAPALNESLTINSTATMPITPTPTPVPTATVQATPVPTTPPQPAAISGSINFNGIAPPNSRIVILQKVYNTQNYQVAVDNITPTNAVTWSWQGPQPSTWYDLIAVLKQTQSNGTDQDLSTSAMTSVAAPASNIIFTLNSGVTLSAPGGPITVACGNESGVTWNAQITFTGVTNAGSYWYQIGSSNGGDDIQNATQNANGNSAMVIGQQMNSGTSYYYRYAYSNLQNQSAGSSQFSPFTNTTQLQCGN